MTPIILRLRPVATYSCASLVVLLPLTQGQFLPAITVLLYGLAIIVLLSHVGDQVQRDLLDGHLAWLISHGQSPVGYFIKQLLASLLDSVIPLTLAFVCIQLFSQPFSIIIILAGSFLMTCLTMVCWGLILVLAQGRHTESMMGIVLAPLAIPNLLIAESLISTVAVSSNASYYLGMQLGIMLVSMGLSVCLAPLVIRNLDW
jgi:hypothetical protein